MALGIVQYSRCVCEYCPASTSYSELDPCLVLHTAIHSAL